MEPTPAMAERLLKAGVPLISDAPPVYSQDGVPYPEPGRRIMGQILTVHDPSNPQPVLTGWRPGTINNDGQPVWDDELVMYDGDEAAEEAAGLPPRWWGRVETAEAERESVPPEGKWVRRWAPYIQQWVPCYMSWYWLNGYGWRLKSHYLKPGQTMETFRIPRSQPQRPDAPTGWAAPGAWIYTGVMSAIALVIIGPILIKFGGDGTNAPWIVAFLLAIFFGALIFAVAPTWGIPPTEKQIRRAKIHLAIMGGIAASHVIRAHNRPDTSGYLQQATDRVTKEYYS